MSQGVIFYQVVIIVIMLVAARFGRTALNRAALALILFTFVNVWMQWLMILQFITIFVAYFIGGAVVPERKSAGTVGGDSTANTALYNDKDDDDTHS